MSDPESDVAARLDRIERLLVRVAVMVNGSRNSSSCGLCGYDYPLHADDCLSPGMRASAVRTPR
jgi:hypothetical protein